MGEIGIASFNFAPKGWALCNGQLLPIAQNQALFSLLGTTYGGDGRVNFALPDLRGRVPIHMGAGHSLGERAGQEAVTVNISQLPAHIHVATATSGSADQTTPGGNLLASVDTTALTTHLYAPPANFAVMAPGTVANSGGSQAHTNMQPYLVLNYCIALQGIFPSPD